MFSNNQEQIIFDQIVYLNRNLVSYQYNTMQIFIDI